MHTKQKHPCIMPWSLSNDTGDANKAEQQQRGFGRWRGGVEGAGNGVGGVGRKVMNDRGAEGGRKN